MNLAARMRAKRFGEIVGQDEAVTRLRCAAGGPRGNVLLVGPSGCGKSSLAHVYAASLLCEAFDGKEACGACQSCDLCASRAHPNLREVDLGESHDEAMAREINQDVATESLSGGWQIFILDHVDRAHSLTLDILRGRFERTPPRVSFIACAETRSSLPVWLRESSDEIDVDYVGVAAAKAALDRIARAEELLADDDALWLIAEQSRGSVRAAVRDLEMLAAQDNVSLDRARARYGVPGGQAICSYLDALVSGDLAAQCSSIAQWPGTARTRGRTLLDVLWQMYLSKSVQVSPSQSLSMATLFSYASRLTSRAQRLPIGAQKFWGHVLRESEEITTETQLLRRICLLDNYLSGKSGEGDEVSERLEQNPPPKARLSRDRTRNSSSSSRSHLSAAQVQKILNAASFMGQEYGVLFNSRISIRYRALGIEDAKGAMDFLGALTHELGQIVTNRDHRPNMHWAYVHEHDGGGLQTHIAAAISLAPIELQRWLDGFIANRGIAAGTLVCRMSDSPRSIKRRHRFLLRLLCRGINPSYIVAGYKGRQQALIDVLGVPLRLRHASAAAGLSQRYRVSKTIGEGVQKRARELGLPLISAWDAGAFHATVTGWELDEHPDRLIRRKIRGKILADLRRSYPSAASAEGGDRYRKKLGDMEKEWEREHEARTGMWLRRWIQP